MVRAETLSINSSKAGNTLYFPIMHAIALFRLLSLLLFEIKKERRRSREMSNNPNWITAKQNKLL